MTSPFVRRLVFTFSALAGAGCASSGPVPAPAAANPPGFAEIAASGGWLTPPATLPAALTPPAGHHVAEHFHATGAQVYTCAPSGDGPAAVYAWKLKQPDAELHDANGAVAGTHGAGPTWTAKDGSSVKGKKVAEAEPPTADTIPWLLVQAVSTNGTGVFSRVTYIQRVATTGGKAPASGCDATALGHEARSDYAAEYFFYAADK
jgi:hypothetical protein